MTTLARATVPLILFVVTALLAAGGQADAKEPGGGLACPVVQSPIDAMPSSAEVTGTCTVRPVSDPLKFHLAFTRVHIVKGGVLTFPDEKIDFSATDIVVEDGGSLIVGTKEIPIGTAGGAVTIRFTGAPPGTCENDWCGKGILVKSGGTLTLYGVKGVPTS